MTKEKDLLELSKAINTNKSSGTFTNANGEVFTIRGLSPLLPQKITTAIEEEWKAAGKSLPICPTYEVTSLGGEKETFAHNEKTLVVKDNPEQTKANQKMWADYCKALAEFEGEYTERIMKRVFLAVDAKPTQAWRDEMKFLGVPTPPVDTVEERYAYVETQVVQSAVDITRLMTDVLYLAGVINEASKLDAEATFQRSLEKALAEVSLGKDKSK